MTRQSRRSLLFLWLVLGVATFCHAASAYLAQYDCAVVKIDSRTAVVSVTFGLLGNNSKAPLSIVIRQSQGELLEKVSIFNEQGQVLHPALIHVGAGTSFPLQGLGPWKLSYDVRLNVGSLTMVPLPVPSIPPSAESRIVNLSLRLPPFERVFGDLFPSMKWRSPQEGYAVMLSVPSLMIVNSKDAAQISAWEKLVTADNMANLSMLILLVVGLSRLGIHLFLRKPLKNTVEA